MKANNEKRLRLVYVPDALCSDSYGFTPELIRIREHFKDVADIEMINGGFRAYGKDSICDIAPFLKKHWMEIQENTNQKFNHSLLSDENYIVDSEPPARAVIVCRILNPAVELNFFFAVQRLVFLESKNTNNAEAFLEILKDFNIDKDMFIRLFESESIRLLAKNDFEKALSWGIRSFPTLFLLRNNEPIFITRRYTKAEPLIRKIETLLASPQIVL